jgi:hypothetical protein
MKIIPNRVTTISIRCENLLLQDVGGDENWHVWSVDLDTQLARDLTPFQGVRADALFVNKKHPQVP